jgi:site-specific DNA-methyltransferase (adenine-specific)
VARKPIEGTIVENCLQWGCGALWIDGTRVKFADSDDEAESKNKQTKKPIGGFSGQRGNIFGAGKGVEADTGQGGRWPANLILEGREEVEELFPMTTSKANAQSDNRMVCKAGTSLQLGKAGVRNPANSYTDFGSASRFFFNFSEQESDE